METQPGFDRERKSSERREKPDWEEKMFIEIMGHSARYAQERGVEAGLIQDRVEICTHVERRDGEPYVVVEYKQRAAMEAPVSEWELVSAIIRFRCERVSRDLARPRPGTDPRDPNDAPDRRGSGPAPDEREMEAAVRAALSQLPPEIGFVAKRCFADGRSVAQVAGELHRSVKWVRYRKDLGKGLLQAQLRKFA